MNPKSEAVLHTAVEALKTALGENLASCCLYGSSVRGNAIDGVSDINLLLVLNESTPAAHEQIADVLHAYPKVDPFILGKPGLERSIRAFAPKFASIRRNYRVLYGEDPLKHFAIDSAIERFLCEQALRNTRLRLVYSFVTRKQHKDYDRFLLRNVTAIFVQCSEVLRLNGAEIPSVFEARIPLLAGEFSGDKRVFEDLLKLKKNPQRMSDAEMVRWHRQLLPLLDGVLRWVEAHWST